MLPVFFLKNQLKKTRMSKFFISSVLLLLLFSEITIAQTADSEKVNALNEVVVTAQYGPQSEKSAVYKVKVINSEIIQKKSSNNLRELLQQELNIDLTQNAVFGTSIDLQGVSKENIKILIDGIPVIGRLNGIIDLNQINLNSIERVEIIEGPVSVFYGTDAMGGIINLITKKEQQKAVEGTVTAYYESIDATNLNADVGYKFGENTIRINGGYYHFNGLSTNEAIRNLNWEERKQYFSDLMYQRKLQKLNLRYNARFTNEKLISIGEPDGSDNIEDTNYYTRRIDNSLNIQGEIFNDKYIDVTVAYLDYQRYHDTFNVDLLTNTSQLSETDIKENNIVKYNFGNFKIQLGKHNNKSKVNYAIGADLNIETTEGERILDKKQDIKTIALLSSINFKLTNNIEIQPGARYTWNSSYGSLISPALNTKIKFDDKSILRFSYARGFRAPSLKELFLDFHISAGPFTYIISGNESLNVEKSHSFNIQYSFTKMFGESGYFLIEPSLFYNDISDLITLSDLVDFKRHYINIKKFKSVGGKINFTYKPTEALNLKAGFSFIGRYNEFNENFITDEFLYSPEVTSTISYDVKKSGTNFSVFYKFSGERTGFYFDEDASNLVKTTRSSFSNLDATVSKLFFKKTVKMAIGVKNIFNIEDIETTNEIGQAHARDLQLWGRSLFLKTNIYF